MKEKITAVDYATSPVTMIWEQSSPITVLPGQYNELYVELVRHATAGSVRVIWNGVQLFNIQNVQTKMQDNYVIRAVCMSGGTITEKWCELDTFHIDTQPSILNGCGGKRESAV